MPVDDDEMLALREAMLNQRRRGIHAHFLKPALANIWEATGCAPMVLA